MPSLSNLHLLAYNSVQAISWAVCLSISLTSVLSTKGVNGAYAYAGDLIYWCQMVAFLEVIHEAIGRANCIFVMRQIHEVQELAAVFITFVAWSISEVIRYPNYALNCIGNCPSWLTYLRYTAFLVLYLPEMGGSLELEFKFSTRHLREEIMLKSEYSYNWTGPKCFTEVVLVCYPFLCVKIYLHMVKQRRSKLGKQNKKKER